MPPLVLSYPRLVCSSLVSVRWVVCWCLRSRVSQLRTEGQTEGVDGVEFSRDQEPINSGRNEEKRREEIESESADELTYAVWRHATLLSFPGADLILSQPSKIKVGKVGSVTAGQRKSRHTRFKERHRREYDHASILSLLSLDVRILLFRCI